MILTIQASLSRVEIIPICQKSFVVAEDDISSQSFGEELFYSIRNIKLKMSVLQAESHLNFDWGKAERMVSC